MALIVEDGTGLPNAESYISVVDTDAYLEARGLSGWASLEVADKESASRRATYYMSAYYGLRRKGLLQLDGLASLWPSYTVMGKDIRCRAKLRTGLPVCVGIAPSKMFTKLSNHLAKKNPEFNGVCDLGTLSTVDIDPYFSKFEVGEVRGIGRRLAVKLIPQGIETVQYLRNASPKRMRDRFEVVMERTVNELQVVTCLCLEEVLPPRKQIISSRSFGEMVTTIDGLREAVSTYTVWAAANLRLQRSF